MIKQSSRALLAGVGTVWRHHTPHPGCASQDQVSPCQSPRSRGPRWVQTLAAVRAVAQPAPPMRSSDWLKASPLSADRLARISLRPRPGARAACSGVNCSKFGLGAEAPLGAREAWISGSSSPRSARFQCGGCSHPEFSGGAEPRKWAHEEEELGNGLLFTPPQTGAGKSRAGARRAAPPDGHLAQPGPGGRDACGRKARERKGDAHRQAESRACLEEEGPRGNLEQRSCENEATQASDRDRAHQTQSERYPGNPGRKEGAPRDGQTRGRSGTQAPAQKEPYAGARAAGRLGALGAGGAPGRVRGQEACPGQEVSRGLVARGDLAPLGAPGSAGLGRAGAAAGAGWAGCLPGLACQQGGGWQLEPQGRALRGGGARLADLERALWRPSQMSGLGLGLA